MKNFREFLSILLVGTLLVLSACGSSAPERAPLPNNPPAPPPPPPPPPGPTSPLPPIPNSPFNTNEFRFSYGLQAVNPIPAYDLGGTGRDVVIAVIDSGFDSTHVDLVGQYDPASADLISGGGRGVSIDGPDNHGAQVAAVIVAKKNGQGMHGVAFGAKVLAIRIDARNTCDNNDCTFFGSDIASAILYAVANGADIINISLGGEGISQAVLNAFAVARDAGVLIVTSAGNDDEPNPNVFSQTPGLAQFLGSGLIVGAVDANLNLASFSNRGGDSRQAFLVAPGVSVGTVQVNNIFTRVSGTSFAAPYVAGAAAIILSMFPNLTGQDLFDILTQSATDLGQNGLDPRFGHGLINIGAAIQPLGQTSFITASAEGDTTTDVPTDQSGSGFSIAFGDSLFRIDGLSQVMMLDSFRRSYFVDARASMLNIYASSFSLENAIDSHRNTQSLFLPIASGEGFSISFADPNHRIRPFIESLPMATQMQLEKEAPYLFFDADISKKMAIGVSFGFNPGVTLDRMTGRGSLNQDFLAARFDGTPHLSLSQNTKSLSLFRRLSSKTSAIIGTSFGVYDFSTQLPFANNLPLARAISSYFRVNHHEGRFSFSLTTGFLKEDNAILGSISTGAL
ncbi:MAG: S8 family peptidase, partial [Sphingomonadales bacterium]